jgi:hypothetical protein
LQKTRTKDQPVAEQWAKELEASSPRPRVRRLACQTRRSTRLQTKMREREVRSKPGILINKEDIDIIWLKR